MSEINTAKASTGWNEGKTVDEILLKRRVERGDVILPNTEALREYANKVRDIQPMEVVHKQLDADMVSKIIMRRCNILMSISRKTQKVQMSVDEHNRKILNLIKLFVMRDETFETEHGLHLHKSLMLRGLQGCGKTTILKALADVGPQEWVHDGSRIQNLNDLKTMSWGDGVRFNLYNMTDIHNCIEIEHDYRRNGESVLAKFRESKRAMVFDDLGFENDKTVTYGNRTNIMSDIINFRYMLWQDYGVPTYWTTNLVDAADVEKMYGIRNRSRLKEMNNTLTFSTENHIDRRN